MSDAETPRPTTAEQAEEEAEERMDELEDADVETSEGVMSREEAEDVAPDDPFDGAEGGDEEPPDVDLAEVDVGEPVEEGDPFDGTESASGSGGSDSRGSWDSGGGSEYEEMGDAAEDLADGNLADNINRGAARMAVIGLDDEFEHNGRVRSKADLQDEFQETFDAFRLGKYGEETAEKYLDFEGEDVDPAVGLAISMLICSVVVIQTRPDGDEILGEMRQKVDNARGE